MENSESQVPSFRMIDVSGRKIVWALVLVVISVFGTHLFDVFISTPIAQQRQDDLLKQHEAQISELFSYAKSNREMLVRLQTQQEQTYQSFTRIDRKIDELNASLQDHERSTKRMFMRQSGKKNIGTPKTRIVDKQCVTCHQAGGAAWAQLKPRRDAFLFNRLGDMWNAPPAVSGSIRFGGWNEATDSKSR